MNTSLLLLSGGLGVGYSVRIWFVFKKVGTFFGLIIILSRK